MRLTDFQIPDQYCKDRNNNDKKRNEDDADEIQTKERRILRGNWGGVHFRCVLNQFILLDQFSHAIFSSFATELWMGIGRYVRMKKE